MSTGVVGAIGIVGGVIVFERTSGSVSGITQFTVHI